MRPDHAAHAAWPALWRTLESGPQDAVRNMAVDLALLDLAHTHGVAVLRTYAWTRPSVSFGRHEPVRDAWDVAAMRAAGFDVVRRPTGGRALLHEAEVTYSAVLPLARGTPWRWAYDAVNRRLLEALRALGVPAALCTAADAPQVTPDGSACFAAPATGELAVHGRKLVGSAVWRSSAAYLQHGTILLQDTQARLAAFRHSTHAAEPPAHATDLSQWLAPSRNSLGARVTTALRGAWSATAPLATLNDWPDADERIHRHVVALDDPQWLWRR